MRLLHVVAFSITLVWVNQRNFFENATACRKRSSQRSLKCWWNQLIIRCHILWTFYSRLNFLLTFWLWIFGANFSYEKRARKTLMKLTTGNCMALSWNIRGTRVLKSCLPLRNQPLYWQRGSLMFWLKFSQIKLKVFLQK